MKDYSKVGSKPGRPSYTSPSRLLSKGAYSRANVGAKRGKKLQNIITKGRDFTK